MDKQKDILKIRNYFGEHDKTPFEHWAYTFLDELAKESNQVQAGVMLPYLHNRADGVNGHYCIARDTKEGYSEFWHNDLKIWCSAGTVFELGKVT